MLKRDYRDLIGGSVMIVIGLWAAVQAWLDYPLGSISHMGPGMFPAGVGVLLAFTGALVFVPALFRAGPALAKPDLRAFFFVLLSLVLFALTVDTFGLIPATAVLTVASVLADNKVGVIGTIVLAAVLSAIAILVFSVGLGIPLEAFKWPL
jgi:putative tricarboxylic transport membrane protein